MGRWETKFSHKFVTDETHNHQTPPRDPQTTTKLKIQNPSVLMFEENPAERRIAKRVGHSEPVQFQANEQELLHGSLSKDISQSGIRLRLSEFLPLGTQLGLQLYLSPDRVVECSGKVVWISQIPHSDYYYAGLQFDDDSVVGDVKTRIQEFIVNQKKPRFKFS